MHPAINEVVRIKSTLVNCKFNKVIWIFICWEGNSENTSLYCTPINIMVFMTSCLRSS